MFIEAFSKNDKLIELMTNKYGHFVLRKAFNLSSDREKKTFFAMLLKNYAKIHSSKYKTRWASFFEECAKINPELSFKLPNKQLKSNRDVSSNEESKNAGANSLGSDENSDNQENPNAKFPGRRKNKLVSQMPVKSKQEPKERSQKRKNTAPISSLKFTTNFS